MTLVHSRAPCLEEKLVVMLVLVLESKLKGLLNDMLGSLGQSITFPG